MTFYEKTADLPDFTDYHMANRTYRYFTGKALFPFGFGLSYTTFRYEPAVLGSTTVGPDGTVHLKFPSPTRAPAMARRSCRFTSRT